MIYTIEPLPPKTDQATKRAPLIIELDCHSNDDGFLKGQAIIECHSQGIQLIGYDLSEAQCQWCCLPGIIVVGCDITNANFTGAYLVGANFCLSNIEDAIFSHAYARQAKTGEFQDEDKVNVLTDYYTSHSVLGALPELDKSTSDIKIGAFE